MPAKLLACMTLPPATITSAPIFDYADANEELADMGTETYYSCCGKSICGGCIYSFHKSGNNGNCPFCNANRRGKTDEERVEEMMKRVEANDAGSVYQLANDYYHGDLGLLQDRAKGVELWKQAAKLGSSHAHFHLGNEYKLGGDMKKAKFHCYVRARSGTI
jgi:TPR repeat protein